MSTADQFNRARALEMFESGEGADCVIEVAQQVQEGQQQVQNNDDNDDAGQDKVYFQISKMNSMRQKNSK
jgi:hypothetical protein